MLHETLARAEQEVRCKRRRFAAWMGLGAVMVVLFLLGVINIDLDRLGVLPEQGRAAVTANTDVPPAAAPPLAEVPPSPPAPGAAVAVDPAARAAFKSELVTFEAELEPAIASDGFTAWNRQAQHRILEDKATAIAAFGAARHDEALATLRQAAAMARDELDAREHAYDDAMAKTAAAVAADDHASAELHIAEALRLRPASRGAMALKQRVDRLPSVLQLIAKAGVARVENDLEAEATFLAQVMEADPSRTALAERLATVRRAIAEGRFARHIEQVLAGIAKRDLAIAERSLVQAKAVYPDRSEVELLSAKVETLARELAVEALIDKAQVATRGDDWRTAEALYRQAGKLLPDSKPAVDGAALAGRINASAAALAPHLAASHRLAAFNVAKQVRGLLAEARPVAAQSPRLAAQVAQLDKLLDGYAAKVSVRVVSDGATDVSVRGVGQVGKTTGRVIELNPGRYTFEGARPGYRSKLVDVDIPLGSERLTVEIVCDEPV